MDFKKFANKKLCVATSGGADSTALLHYVKSLQKECGFSLSAVHCEHGIRGEESKEDRDFVLGLCKEWGVPCRVFEADCLARAKAQKMSLETAAREFRRESFASLVESGEADFILTAHHLQDEAETVLFRLARGSALSGAIGIKAQEGFYLRPFLTWSKKKILGYIEENHLSFKEDSTNYCLDATRNILRWKVLPVLEDAVPSAAENLVKFSLLAAQDDEFLYALSEQLLREEDQEICVAFDKHFPIFSRACLLAMKKMGVEKDYTQAHLTALFELQNCERGAMLYLPFGVRAKKDLHCVRFYKEREKCEILPLKTEEQIFSENAFDGGRYAVKVQKTPPLEEDCEKTGFKVLRVDSEKIPPNAVFRFRKEGDKIEKFGGGTQSLKKFFNEKKIPVEVRAQLPLIAEREGDKVFAVCGVEIADCVKISKTTSKSFYIILQKK